MVQTIWFKVIGQPVAWTRPTPFLAAKRVVVTPATLMKFVRVLTSKRMRLKRAEIAAVAKLHAPPEPFQGAVSVSLRFVFKMPTNWPVAKRKKAADGWLFRSITKHGDNDNLEKLFNDALEDSLVFFTTGDQQIQTLSSTRWYGAEAATYVAITEIVEDRIPPWAWK